MDDPTDGVPQPRLLWVIRGTPNPDWANPPKDALNEAMKLGVARWNELTALPNATALREAIFNLSEEELRAFTLAAVAIFHQQRLQKDDPDAYGTWWD